MFMDLKSVPAGAFMEVKKIWLNSQRIILKIFFAAENHQPQEVQVRKRIMIRE